MLKKSYKFILLYFSFVISIFALYYPVDLFSEKGIELQKEILLKEAQTHFYNQVNTRKWNAMYGGVYVKPRAGQIPNPYLRDNILKVDDNLTLLKINPAWMTRQLSEISDIKSFHFRITSLNPLNPQNTMTPFEKRALQSFENSDTKEFYEFNEKSFDYMGALQTTKACLPCHKHQGYKVGDIRGGISVSLDNSKYINATQSIKSHAMVVKIFVLLFLLSITILIHKQLKNNELLKIKVRERTKEIESTKKLLQNILDSDPSSLFLLDGDDVVYTNKTLLDFFGFKSLNQFQQIYPKLSDLFEDVDDDLFFTKAKHGKNWLEELKKEQDKKTYKVLIKKDSQKRYYKPHVKEMNIDDKKLCLVILDDISKQYKKMQELEQEASRDFLTKLFNRAKFNDVLKKEMELSDETLSHISLIFIDIDHFKNVNDTYGHDKGDDVLVALAKIITGTIRQGDFVARWGGEEFIIIMNSINSEEAVKIAEKLRVKVENYHFDSIEKQTISCGVTEYIQGESRDELIKRVDEALYESKKSGRNKVTIK